MDRPKREDFETKNAYDEARAAYVEHMLGAGGRVGARIAALEEQLAELKKKPAPPPPLDIPIEEEIRGYAHKLIHQRYDGFAQLNIMRKGQRLGASRDELLALEIMDEWIEAVRAACQSHLAEYAALPEDARAGYDWLQGWPKEA